MLKIREIKAKIGFIGTDRKSILEDLSFAIENGFNYYEIQAVKELEMGRAFNLKSGMIKQAKKISKENNISLILHASYFKSLCSVNHKISKEAFKFLKKEIILAGKIGAKQITIHGGELNNGTTIVKNFEILIEIENFKEIIKLGRKYGIKIGLENSFTLGKLCRTPEDLLKVLNSVKELGITFDIGHANLINLNPIKYFKKVKNFVIDIHIHDNDSKSDQHRLIGEGNINFKSFIRECKNSNYYGPFIFEVFPYKNVLKCREKFLNIWNQI